MKISILIPVRNEEKSIEACILSCLSQTRTPDEIVVVNDNSDDRTLKILRSFKKKIKVINLSVATGNKSYVQEEGLKYVKGDIVITTDGDTILDRDFVKNISLEFKDRNVMACAGYVKSLKQNWLTASREIEYLMGQEVHKQAQSHIDALFVIPGCAAAYRTKIFKKHISIDHDTLTEDLDFTYKHHKKDFKIAYSKKAIAYTQDPATISDYVTQLRRWYGGSWQNLLKHYDLLKKPKNALELSLIFTEGIIFPLVLLAALLFNQKVFAMFYISYFMTTLYFAFYGAFRDKRLDVLLIVPFHLFISFINYAIFIEQFLKEFVFKKNNLIWTQAVRRRAYL